MDWPLASATANRVDQFGRFGNIHVDNPNRDATCRIIAVPGLAGNPHWEWTSYSPETHRACDWLNDLLPKHFPSAEIATYHYNLLPGSIGGFLSADGLAQAATRLLDMINGMDETNDKPKTTPLIFVAHDLGGIVVKKALLMATDDDKYWHIALACQRIIFFGTPHRAPDEESWEDLLLSIILASPAKLRMVPSMTTRISRLAPFLEDLSKRFLHRVTECRFVNIYQQVDSSSKDRLVVHPYSATMGVVHETILPRKVNHTDLPTFAFSSDGDPVFLHIINAIKAEHNPKYRACLSRLARIWPALELFQSHEDDLHRFLELKQWEGARDGPKPEALDSVDGHLAKSDILLAIGENALDARSLFQCIRSTGRLAVYFSPSTFDTRLQSPDALWGLAVLQLLLQAPHLFSHVEDLCHGISEANAWTETNASTIFQRLLVKTGPTASGSKSDAPVYLLIENLDMASPAWKPTFDVFSTMRSASSASKQLPRLSRPALKLILLYDRDNKDLSAVSSWATEKPLDPSSVFDQKPLKQFSTAAVARRPQGDPDLEKIGAQYQSLIVECGYDAQKMYNLRAIVETPQQLVLAIPPTGSYLEDLPHRLREITGLVFLCLPGWARIALGWHVCAKRPLTPDELLAAIQLSVHDSSVPKYLDGDFDSTSIVTQLRDIFGPLIHANSERICLANKAILDCFVNLAVEDWRTSHQNRDHQILRDTEPKRAEFEASPTKQAIPDDIQIAETLLECISRAQTSEDRSDPHLLLRSYAVQFWQRHLLDGDHNLALAAKPQGDKPSPRVLKIVKNGGFINAWQNPDFREYRSIMSHTDLHRMRGSLMLAAQVGLRDVVVGLREDSKAEGEIEAAICAAARYGNTAIVDILMSFGVDREHFALKAALEIASLRNCIPITERLLDCVAKTDSRAELLRRLAREAARLGYGDQLKLLVTHGAQVDTHIPRGKGPLQYAAENGHLSLVKYLVIEAGATVFDKGASASMSNSPDTHTSGGDDNGKDALCLAAQGGHADIVEFLLDDAVIQNNNIGGGNADGDSGRTEAEAPAGNTDTDNTRRPKQKAVGTWIAIEKAMIAACKGGHVETARRILNHATVISVPRSQRSVNHQLLCSSIEAEKGSGDDCLAMLIFNSAKPADSAEELVDPFVCAASFGCLAFVQRCLDLSREPDIKHLLDGSDSTGRKALHCSARNGHTDVVELLLKRGADVDSIDGDDVTPLAVAAVAGQLATVRLLLQMGADVQWTGMMGQGILISATKSPSCDREAGVIQALIDSGASLDAMDDARRTALHWAARRGHINVLEVILKQAGVDVRIKGDRETNALHHAARNPGRTAAEAAEMLIAAGASTQEADVDGWLPVHSAAACNSVDVMELLLLRDEEAIGARSTSGDTILHSAYGSCDTLIWLIDHGFDLDAKNTNGTTTLMRAAGNGEDAPVGLLLAAGASTDALDSFNHSALQRALAGGTRSDVTSYMLLEANPAVFFQLDKNGTSILFMAISRGMTDFALKVLDGLEKHSAANNMHDELVKVLDAAAGPAKRTPLVLAARKKLDQVVKRLLQLGPNLEQRDYVGNTALVYAIRAGNEPLVRAFLDAQHRAKRSPGSKERSSSHEKNSEHPSKYPAPLQCAAMGGRTSIVKLLLSDGADVNEQSGSFNTALTAAAAGSFDEVVDLLLQNNADAMLSGGAYSSAVGAAVASGSTTTVDLLLRKNKDAALVRDVQGRNALHVAVRVGLWDAFERILAAHEDPNEHHHSKNHELFSTVMQPDKQGRTLLHFAAGCTDPEVLRNLLAHPKLDFEDDIDVLDNDGWTPLHWACRAEDGTDVVKALLELKANPSLETKDGWTPLNISQYHGATEIASVIEDALASRAEKLGEKKAGDGADDRHLEPGYVNWGVSCDGCLFREVNGACFKCNDCQDFDFCFKCHWSAPLTHYRGHTFNLREGTPDPGKNRGPPYQEVDQSEDGAFR